MPAARDQRDEVATDYRRSGGAASPVSSPDAQH
jgi:hypothetical protein